MSASKTYTSSCVHGVDWPENSSGEGAVVPEPVDAAVSTKHRHPLKARGLKLEDRFSDPDDSDDGDDFDDFQE